jgi:hypothetical protein
MKRPIQFASLLVLALLAGGCAGFESGSSVTAPSQAAAVASLLGTWSSQSAGEIASGCSNFQWKITAQSDNALSGEFSAACASGISASGVATGSVSGSDVSYTVTGTANIANVASCPFLLSGVAHVVSSSEIRVPYSGTTCLGPLSGEETLRRPTPPSAPAPAPASEPPASAPPPSSNPYHVGAGPLTAERAEVVIRATGNEFPGLTAPRGSEGEGVAAAEELLRRMIWHLHLAGYDAGRQRNPSGAISNDKLTIFINGTWHAYDCFRNLGTPGIPIDVIFLEVFPAGHVDDGGIPD